MKREFGYPVSRDYDKLLRLIDDDHNRLIYGFGQNSPNSEYLYRQPYRLTGDSDNYYILKNNAKQVREIYRDDIEDYLQSIDFAYIDPEQEVE